LRLCLVFILLMLVGCADISPQSRRQNAGNFADQAGWHKLSIPTDHFTLSAYVPKTSAQSDTLTVYIEGDGLAWLTRSQASNDPTPRNPIGLQLALRHPKGLAVYLARPCQYDEAINANNCRQTYWTDGRFAPEVIEASNQAISVLKQRMGAKQLILVGYSGGGAVAALVAARRSDIAELITVAGNLDHRVWTSMHHVPALKDSLNPADVWQSLIKIPQRHFVGARDDVVSQNVTEAFVSKFPVQKRPQVVVIPDFDHVCCWIEKWSLILDNRN
jgi:hypothetical protein